MLKQKGRESNYIPGGAFYLPLDISSSGMSSDQFALELLKRKRVAVAPGTAFDTDEPFPQGNNESKMQQNSEYPSRSIFLNKVFVLFCYSFENKVTDSLESTNKKRLLKSFCRISLANDTKNVVTGVNRICEFLDELELK